MADASFIGSDTVSIVPNSAYDDLRKQLQELHGNAAASSPSGGALPPTAPSASSPAGGAPPPAARPKIGRFEYHPYQIMAAERVHLSWRLMVALARQRVKSEGRYRWLSPGQFALLLSKSPDLRAIALQTQKHNLEVLVAAEAKRYTDTG